MTNSEYVVTFYFSSGKELIADYSHEDLMKMVSSISKSWNTANYSNEEFGMNFAHVTHYQVKKQK